MLVLKRVIEYFFKGFNLGFYAVWFFVNQTLNTKYSYQKIILR